MKAKLSAYALLITFALGVAVGAALFVLLQGYILILAAIAVFSFVAKLPKKGRKQRKNEGGENATN